MIRDAKRKAIQAAANILHAAHYIPTKKESDKEGWKANRKKRKTAKKARRRNR